VRPAVADTPPLAGPLGSVTVSPYSMKQTIGREMSEAVCQCIGAEHENRPLPPRRS
jgi:hypothetical protein